MGLLNEITDLLRSGGALTTKLPPDTSSSEPCIAEHQAAAMELTVT